MRHALRIVGMLLLAPLSAAAQDTSSVGTSKAIAAAQDEIRSVLREHNAAVLRRERAGVEELYAPRFVAVHAYGYVDDPDTQIEIVLDSDPPRQWREPTFAAPGDFALYGDVAVSRSLQRAMAGEPTLVTLIWAKTAGRWRMVQTQWEVKAIKIQ